MILSLPTVFALERLRVGVAIDRASILTAVDAEAFGKVHRRKLWAALCEAAMTYAVDLDERDVVFVETTTDEDRDRNRVVYRARWSPQTNEIELVGGPADGKVFAVERPRDPFVVCIDEGTPSEWYGYPTQPTPVVPQRLTYNPDGWNEQTRRWVSSCEEWNL
jgi:hypothetical protein